MSNQSIVSKSFFRDIRNSKLLSKKEELELIKKYHETNDTKYRDKIVLSNVKFIVRSTLDYATPNIDSEDLFCEGLCGMMHALDKYDIKNNNVKFISYAAYWVKHYMRKYINDSCKVKVPTAISKKIRKMLTSNDYDEQENDIFTVMALNAVSTPRRIDESIENGSTHTIADIIPDTKNETAEKTHYGQLLSKELVDIINGTLPPLKADIILKTYGLNNSEVEWTLRDISSESNYSHERIRQLRQEALRELRNKKELVDLKNKYQDYNSMV